MSDLVLCVLPGGGCEIPVPLQGTEIGVISDAECTSVWGDSFQESNMICVWDGASGTVGACNVRAIMTAIPNFLLLIIHYLFILLLYQ